MCCFSWEKTDTYKLTHSLTHPPTHSFSIWLCSFWVLLIRLRLDTLGQGICGIPICRCCRHRRIISSAIQFDEIQIPHERLLIPPCGEPRTVLPSSHFVWSGIKMPYWHFSRIYELHESGHRPITTRLARFVRLPYQIDRHPRRCNGRWRLFL